MYFMLRAGIWVNVTINKWVEAECLLYRTRNGMNTYHVENTSICILIDLAQVAKTLAQ